MLLVVYLRYLNYASVIVWLLVYCAMGWSAGFVVRRETNAYDVFIYKRINKVTWVQFLLLKKAFVYVRKFYVRMDHCKYIHLWWDDRVMPKIILFYK